MMKTTEIFFKVDEFFKGYEPAYRAQLLAKGRQRMRSGDLTESEIMTILILFHSSC